jgi:hypothetical protein
MARPRAATSSQQACGMMIKQTESTATVITCEARDAGQLDWLGARRANTRWIGAGLRRVVGQVRLSESIYYL